MASRKKAKPKEVRKNAFERFRDQHRISLVLFPVFFFITFGIYAVYGFYNPLGWLYGLCFLMLTTLIFIAEGTSR